MNFHQKRGYYIHFNGRQFIGVSKKIDMQLEEFCRQYSMEEVEVKALDRNIIQRVFGLFPTASISRNYEEALSQIEEPDFVYVRRTVADRKYLLFLRTIREKFPNCKIIIEIFTYPYDRDDFYKWDAWPFLLKEWIYRPQLKKYVNRFVTYSDDDLIFGIPTIKAINGVSFDKVQCVSGSHIEGEINLLGVAFMQRQHGYERVIEGIYRYYEEGGQEIVRLHLVGDGPEKQKYRDLVEQFQLEDKILFYPTLDGKELEEMYDRCDIALIAFGMYKVGFTGKISAIKSREYMAKGMPMISGAKIDVLEENYPYIKLFPNNQEPVDIKEIITFYKGLLKIESNKVKLALKIREDAKQRVSMESALKPIVDYIDMK